MFYFDTFRKHADLERYIQVQNKSKVPKKN